MTEPLKRLIKNEMLFIQQDADETMQNYDLTQEKIECIKRHLATIENEIAYELKNAELKQVSV